MIVRKSGRILVIALLVASFSVARADIATGLAGHWMMDDGVGAVATDSVAGNDGILQGDATWASGFAGGAVLLDGLGDYIDCGNQAAFNITDAVTLAAWLQASGDFAYPDWSGVIMRGGPNIDTYALYYNKAGGQLGFKTTGATPEWFASETGSAAMLFDAEWHHVAATYDGATKVIYMDGAPVISAAATGKIEASSGRLLIGAGRDLTPATHFVAGRIDEARLYNRALTAKDVKEFFPPKLQAYKPDPADGATGVAAPLFKWTAGDTAVLHEMYIGKTPDLGPANLAGPRTTAVMLWYVPGLEAGTTYYWRVDEIEIDGATIHTGNVWTFITQALTAYHPTPADGSTDVAPGATLTWLPGQSAVEHHVYFSDSFADVNDGTPAGDKGTLETPAFTPDGLDPAATYYWRVDELVAGGGVKTGPVWTFMTHLPIDDFESYTDDEGGRIYQTWIDGYADKSSGSTVGHIDAPFAEQQIVHGGMQSMPLDYNNIDAPFFSEAQREFDPVQDWTINDVNTLVLIVRGKVTNSPTLLYITVEDASRKAGTVVHSEPAVVATAKWIEWRIPFGEFTAAGVNMARVKKLTLGLGDKNDPKPGAAGMIYIDDIRAIKP